MKNRYVMAIDQGTGGTRVIVFNRKAEILAMAYEETTPIYPEPGWVEHDPTEIWKSVTACMGGALRQGRITPKEIAAVGITNQRESVVMWDRTSGEPLYNSINWQCRRTASLCEDLRKRGYEEKIKTKTGLVVDPYFSATKIRWMIENVKEIREKIDRGSVCAGTIDSWVIWNLSGGRYHVTDYSNASRTLLLNIYSSEWDEELLSWFGVPKDILPRLHPSSGIMARTDPRYFFGEEVPISGDAGDQHAALFGQCCFDPGMAKCTFGTALSIVMNTGGDPVASKHGLLTDLAWRIGERPEYALEGAVYVGGAVIRWLRDGLKIIKSSSESSAMAENVPDTGGVYMVPAFTGLCAPFWDPYARGLIIGITSGTNEKHIARSALESIAYQARDILETMKVDAKTEIRSLRADGGATKSDFLMQFQADILGIPIEKPSVTEMTALGACYLAGLGVRFWESREEIRRNWELERRYEPRMDPGRREELYAGWKRAVKRSMNWGIADPGISDTRDQ
jgi:glycerol kinase